MSEPRRSLSERLAQGRPLLLDAAMGTEIDRRGLPTTLPLWSARGLIERPDLVRAIHLDNLRAGADIITTNTFRTTRRMLARAGRDPDEAILLDRRAVELAIEARAIAERPDALIAGSIAPLEDCYSPELTPPGDVALAEHRAQATTLAEAGVDFLMVETMPTILEAEMALIAARATGFATTVGFVCAFDEHLGTPPRLLSGESLAAAVARVELHDPAAILVNCAPPPVITAALTELRGLTKRPLGGYANIGEVDDSVGWAPDDTITGARYAQFAATWLAIGARLIGGCCGTTPAHTESLHRLVSESEVRSQESGV